MHVEIDHVLCVGYGVCVQSAPEVFAINDDGESAVTRPDVDGELESVTRLAEVSCPMQAVRIS